MKIGDVIEVLERFAPTSDAEEWDRVGLMAGSRERECSAVMVTLDVTPAVIDKAIREGANLIVSHHPFIWDRLASVDEDSPKGAMIEKLIKNDVAVYSAHTNLDKAEGGVNSRLAVMLGGRNIALDGIGATFEVGGISLEDLARKVADVLGDDTVLYVGDAGRKIFKAYVVGGAGGSEYARAKEVADVLITGELKHNQYVEAGADGFSLIQFSHFFSERITEDILRDALSHCDIKIIGAAQDCPFRRIDRI